jgi:hypothetical protein
MCPTFGSYKLTFVTVNIVSLSNTRTHKFTLKFLIIYHFTEQVQTFIKHRYLHHMGKILWGLHTVIFHLPKDSPIPLKLAVSFNFQRITER